MMRLSRVVLLVVGAWATVLLGCAKAGEPESSGGTSIDPEALTSDYFVGEWCLVRSTRNGADESPTINFRFGPTATLAFESASGSGKFRAGSYSWKPEANLFLLRTPPTLMGTAKIEHASEDSFVLGGKIGYTFSRGQCGE